MLIEVVDVTVILAVALHAYAMRSIVGAAAVARPLEQSGLDSPGGHSSV